MFSKQEASQLRKDFWTTFGQYMKPVPSADGEKVNWVNYKTGEKDILFRMEAGNKKATISIDLVHSDIDIQQLYYEQFVQLKQSSTRLSALTGPGYCIQPIRMVR